MRKRNRGWNIKHMKRVTAFQSQTHCLLCGSFSLIFSRTLISNLAASLYLSWFLMIFNAIWFPPLFLNTVLKKKIPPPHPTPPLHTLHIDSTWNFWWKTYLLWSTHWTTFPKVPSPKVSTISSARQIKISLMTEHRNEAAYSSYICAATYICLQGRHHFCRSGDHFQSPSHCHLQPGRFFSANKVSHIHDKVEQKIKKTSTCFCHTPPKNTPSNIWPLGL